MNKPVRAQVKDDLPAVDSGDDEDDGEEWSSGVESLGEESEGILSDDDEGEDDNKVGNGASPPVMKSLPLSTFENSSSNVFTT